MTSSPHHYYCYYYDVGTAVVTVVLILVLRLNSFVHCYSKWLAVYVMFGCEVGIDFAGPGVRMNVDSLFLLLPHGSVWQSPARQFQPTWVCHLWIPEFSQ